MFHRFMTLGVVAASVLLLVAGCAQTSLRPYQNMTDMKAAARQADLVIESAVAATDEVEHFPGGSIESNIFGKMGQECIVKTRVTLDATKVLGGPTSVAGPVTFWFFGPCWHAEPDVLLNVSLPPVLTVGHRFRFYLQLRNGEYWLIAHDRLYPE